MIGERRGREGERTVNHGEKEGGKEMDVGGREGEVSSRAFVFLAQRKIIFSFLPSDVDGSCT